MLLGCFAWLMHITPLLTPLWDDSASLGHGICIQLAPVVSASHQYDEHHGHDSHFEHTSIGQVSASATAHSSVLSLEQLLKHTDHSSGSTDVHNHCDICTAMSAVILPIAIQKIHAHFIELFFMVKVQWWHLNVYYSFDFVRPFLRAPPALLFA